MALTPTMDALIEKNPELRGGGYGVEMQTDFPLDILRSDSFFKRILYSQHTITGEHCDG